MAHNLQVGTTALYVSGEFDYTLESGDALYYGDSPGVSVSSNIGTLAAGDTIARASNSYIVSAGTSYVKVNVSLNHDGSTVGFYGTAPVARQTGVAVDAAGIHAALVALGLITA